MYHLWCTAVAIQHAGSAYKRLDRNENNIPYVVQPETEEETQRWGNFQFKQEILTSSLTAEILASSKSVIMTEGEKIVFFFKAKAFNSVKIRLYVPAFLFINKPNTHGTPENEC